MFSDMLSEFKRNLEPETHGLEATMLASFMEVNEREHDEDYDMEQEGQAVPTSSYLHHGGLPPVPDLNRTGAPGGGGGVERHGLNLTGAAQGGLHFLRQSTAVPTTLGLNLTGAAGLALNLTGATTPGVRRHGFAPPSLDVTGAAPTPGLYRTQDAPGLNLTGAPAAATPLFNRTGIAAAAPSLNITGLPAPDLSAAGASWLDASAAVGSRPCLDITDAAGLSLNPSARPSLTAVQPPTPVARASAVLTAGVDIDPFAPEVHNQLMSQLARPVDRRHGYLEMGTRLPVVRVGSLLNLGQDKFFVTALKGEGGFAKVFSATREDETGLDSTIAGIDAVLKVLLVLASVLLDFQNVFVVLGAVFRIRISFHADPDPGSQKCPYGSGCGSGSKEVNTKEE